MSIKRLLMGKVRFGYFPSSKWFSYYFTSQWGGKLIYIHISRFCMTIDCRKDFIKDMMTGKIE